MADNAYVVLKKSMVGSAAEADVYPGVYLAKAISVNSIQIVDGPKRDFIYNIPNRGSFFRWLNDDENAYGDEGDDGDILR